MKNTKPELYILAGPNGSGKTTCAKMLLPRDVPFVNADEIAKGLEGFEGIPRDVRASRILLQRISEFEAAGKSFALETNLANRALLQRIKRLQGAGYTVTLLFLWLRSVDLAIDRVMERVRRGGHSVPAEVIRRRYQVGRRNFLEYYRNEVDSWMVFDNSYGKSKPMASCRNSGSEAIFDDEVWELFLKGVLHE